ncbi:MAG: phosphoribulokinase [Hyphomicrobiaceae bacterium]|nr:phosphoribulokinase [Hyphomicrobiaceae bacterium]
MSKKHPVIAVTGSSGAGTSTVKTAFEHILRRENVKAEIVEGDSYHRYDRMAMKTKMAEEEQAGNLDFSHFGANANLFDKIAELFETYGRTGGGQKRYYVHNDEEAVALNKRLGCDVGSGDFTPWEDLAAGTDMLFYEGLHGLVKDAAPHVDLGIGVVPIVNLEWIQKIFRDNDARGYAEDVIVDTILRRMHDYVHDITPQFGRTDINFQRVPTVDTSNPFIARDIPTPDESMVVIRFAKPSKFNVDFPHLLSMLEGSFMSRRNTIVVPGGKMGLAMEVILTPIIHDLYEASKTA